jgi:hypothetical protein
MRETPVATSQHCFSNSMADFVCPLCPRIISGMESCGNEKLSHSRTCLEFVLGSAIYSECPTGTRLTDSHDCRRREIYSSDGLTGEMDFRPLFGLDFFRLYAECVYRGQVLEHRR